MNLIKNLPGPFLVFLGAVSLSFGGLIVKSFEGSTLWQILFWRSVFFIIVVTIFLLFSYKKRFFSILYKSGLPGLIGGIICGSLFFLLGKDWPSQLSLAAYGDDKIYYPPKENTGNAISISFKALSGAINHPAFWILTITFFICGLTSTGIIGQHFIPFCADNNVGIIMASSYLALMGFFNFIGTMGSGWLSDRYNNYTLLAAYYGLRGLSLFYLPYSNFDVYSLTLWAIFFGLDFIATVPPTVKLSGQFFGTINGPIVFGWIFGAHQLGSAVAAYGSGLSRDILSTYVPAFLLAGLACFIATMLFIYLLTFKPKFSVYITSNSI